jgi:hypothetical protein
MCEKSGMNQKTETNEAPGFDERRTKERYRLLCREVLRAAMRKSGLPVSRVGTSVGLADSQVSRIMRGQSGMSGWHLIAISERYGIAIPGVTAFTPKGGETLNLLTPDQFEWLRLYTDTPEQHRDALLAMIRAAIARPRES